MRIDRGSCSAMAGVSGKKLNHRERRKVLRKLRKAKGLARCGQEGEKQPTMAPESSLEPRKPPAACDKKSKKRSRRKKRGRLEQEREPGEVEKRERQAKRESMFKDGFQDDEVLKEMEKKLRMKKTKKLPRAFIDDGLDYLLDIFDEEKCKNDFGDLDDGENFETECNDSEEQISDDADLLDRETTDNEDNDDPQAIPELISNTQIDTSKSILKTKNSRHSNEREKKRRVRWIGTEKDDNSEGEESKETNKLKGAERGSRLQEDIYGRLRDDMGNIVADVNSSYIPPAKRMKTAGSDDHERLKKQLKGLVNRLSESNMLTISSQAEELYQLHSRAGVNLMLSTAIMDITVSISTTPEQLMMELSMLVAILHSNVGSEIGAFFLEKLAERFKNIYENWTQSSGGKQLDNIITMFCCLYNFKVVHSILIFDVMKKLCETFNEKDIELLLLILRNCGFNLRKDDPVSLKDAILEIQKKASSVDKSGFTDQCRIQFILETLTAVKNNNMRKIPNLVDISHLEHLKKVVKSCIREVGLADNQLHVHLNDLLSVNKRGRWWIIGSAWDEKSEYPVPNATSEMPSENDSTISRKILKIAQQQQMNTDVRRKIFCILMTSEDYIDAFDKLLHLGLKQQQGREIIHVIVDCCLQERAFNPFYAYLTQKFCEYNRQFQMTFQFNLWDRLKEMESLSEHGLVNLSQLLAHLIATKAQSLAVLKVIEFGTVKKTMVKFLKQLLVELLLKNSDEDVEAAFSRITSQVKLHAFHEGLRLFMQHFLLGKKADNIDNPSFKAKVQLAVKRLGLTRNTLLL